MGRERRKSNNKCTCLIPETLGVGRWLILVFQKWILRAQYISIVLRDVPTLVAPGKREKGLPWSARWYRTVAIFSFSVFLIYFCGGGKP